MGMVARYIDLGVGQLDQFAKDFPQGLKPREFKKFDWHG
jgi:hypothetical protein